MKSLNFLIAAISLWSADLFAAQVVTQKEVNVLFSDVYVQRSRGIVEPHELLMTGVFPNGCYKWNKAEVEHKDDFTHEVKGKANVAQGICTMVMVPFTKEVDLGVLKRGEHLVRVVNADGTIIEKKFTLE